MKIWWCQEHESGTTSSDESCDLFLTGRYSVPCRMVPMRLIPDNEEAIQRVAKVVADYDWWREPNAEAIMAALDGETP